MDEIEIRRMSPNDMRAACKVLGLAFADNPNTLVIARGDRARAQRMTESGRESPNSGEGTATFWSPKQPPGGSSES